LTVVIAVELPSSLSVTDTGTGGRHEGLEEMVGDYWALSMSGICLGSSKLWRLELWAGSLDSVVLGERYSIKQQGGNHARCGDFLILMQLLATKML
jgi:hypothetical protein